MTIFRIKLLAYSDLFLKFMYSSEMVSFKIVFINLLESAIDDDRLFKELFK